MCALNKFNSFLFWSSKNTKVSGSEGGASSFALINESSLPAPTSYLYGNESSLPYLESVPASDRSGSAEFGIVEWSTWYINRVKI